jgi:hypothetical protein
MRILVVVDDCTREYLAVTLRSAVTAHQASDRQTPIVTG